jgi:hypothetical protein
MPRYVILAHDHPFPHWDFMLEAGNVLQTWRLLAEPGPQRTVAAERVADHRPAYLDYEGPVSGGRGNVTRWDYGAYEMVRPDGPPRLRLRGTRDLQFAELASGNEGDSWTFGGFEQPAPNLANDSSSESADPGRTP